MSSDVAWAVSARARTPALDPLQGGELILLPPAAVDWLGGEGMFASLIAGFRQAGASAVCVWFRPDAAARAAAEINKLPLLFVANLSPTELERVVVTHIAGQLRSGLAQQTERQTNLLDALAANRGLDSLLKVVTETFGSPAAYIPAVGQPTFSRGRIPLPEIAVGQEFTVIASPDSQSAWWGALVGREGKRLGTLVVVAPRAEPKAAETLAMRQAAAAIAVELGRLEAVAEVEDRLRTEFLRDLFAGRSTHTLYGRARSLGLALHEDGPLMIIGSVDPRLTLSSYVKDRLHTLLVRQSAFPMLDEGAEVMALLPATLRGDPAPGPVLRALSPFAGDYAAGFSEPLGDVRRVAEALQEARIALLVSRRVRDGAPTHFGETGAYGLLAPLAETTVGKRVIESTLGMLVAYDREHNAHLTDTIETYIACNFNASATAQRLNLHRNSLAYRLHKIEDLIGLQLSDSEDRLLTTLAVRLRALL